MKSDQQPGATTGLTSAEGSGLLDIRSMSKSIQDASEQGKKRPSLNGLSNDFAPAALGGSVLLPVPVKRSGGALKIVAIFLGSVLGLTLLIVGLLFAVGVLPPQEDPAPVALAQTITPPPTAITPATEPSEAPVAEVEEEEEPQKGSNKKRGSKSRKTAKSSKSTKTPAKTSNTPNKRKKNSREADELLGILGD